VSEIEAERGPHGKLDVYTFGSALKENLHPSLASLNLAKKKEKNLTDDTNYENSCMSFFSLALIRFEA
jgi:hypothetical protein